MRKHGFTLLEMSVVLVIIALVIGGVLVGRDLIDTARSRSQISEWDKMNATVNTFRLKYNCLPGDCRNATQHFPGTVNGNGNGFVQTHITSVVQGEIMWFFNHMHRAGLVDITGQSPTGWPWGWSDNVVDVGVVIPEMKTREQGAWFVLEPTATDPARRCFNGGLGSTGPYVPLGRHYFTTGVVLGVYGEITEHLYIPPYIGVARFGHGAMSTSQAFFIDSKIDDGLPQTGSMVSTRTTTNSCSHQQIDVPTGSFCINSNLQYNINYTATAPCSPMVATSF